MAGPRDAGHSCPVSSVSGHSQPPCALWPRPALPARVLPAPVLPAHTWPVTLTQAPCPKEEVTSHQRPWGAGFRARLTVLKRLSDSTAFTRPSPYPNVPRAPRSDECRSPPSPCVLTVLRSLVTDLPGCGGRPALATAWPGLGTVRVPVGSPHHGLSPEGLLHMHCGPVEVSTLLCRHSPVTGPDSVMQSAPFDPAYSCFGVR